MRILMEKLIRISHSIGVESNVALHDYLLDAQDYVLQMQRETAEASKREAMAKVSRLRIHYPLPDDSNWRDVSSASQSPRTATSSWTR